MDLTSYIEFATEMAHRSGDFIRPYFGDLSVVVESKADLSPVTVADRGAEKLMRDLIAERYPDHGVIGEEYGNENTGADWVWVLDPIDGTKSFAAAVPLFGTLIALQYQGEPVLGLIHQPILRQLCMGTSEGTALNGNQVRVRAAPPLERALLLTTDTKAVGRYQSEPGWNSLVAATGLLRSWGDCYGYLLLSSGWADIMCDPKMEVWDLAAIVPIVRGAGGAISGWDGTAPRNSAVATHPDLHDAVLSQLNR